MEKTVKIIISESNVFYDKVRVRYNRQNKNVELMISLLRTEAKLVPIEDLVAKCYSAGDGKGLISLDTITIEGEFTLKKDDSKPKYELKPEFENYLKGHRGNAIANQIKYTRTGAILLQDYCRECTVGDIRLLLCEDALCSLTLNLMDRNW